METRRPRGRPSGSTGDELLAAARKAFLEFGFDDTTMELVATTSGISKQTLYRHHASKADLFHAVVIDWVDQGNDAMRPYVQALLDASDIGDALTTFAHVLQSAVLSDAVLRMRQLITREAPRFPQVAATYNRKSWDRNVRMLAGALRILDQRSALRVPDADIAAEQFTWLVLATPLNWHTFNGISKPFPKKRREAIAAEAVATFLHRHSMA